MNASIGRITVQLAAPTDESPTPDLIALINGNVAPPNPVTGQDVFVRSMFIVSDQINSCGGRFPVEEHSRLAELLVDSPVLVGHRKDHLPIARTFHARLIERDGQHWVQSYFFWLRSADGALNLKDNIDGGIYKECSIGFTFHLPLCSICGQDIRTCTHEPLTPYVKDGVEQVCHYDYREIERVLETSLVYRGAIPNTAIGKGLDPAERAVVTQSITSLTRPSLRDLAISQPETEFLVMPRYQGIPVTVRIDNGLRQIKLDTGENLEESSSVRFPAFQLVEGITYSGCLVGFQGKERCSVAALRQHLSGNGGQVSRVQLLLFPAKNTPTISQDARRQRYSARTIRHLKVTGAEILSAVRQLMTKHGIEVRPVNASEQSSKCWLYSPAEITESQNHYALSSHRDQSTACLRLDSAAVHEQYEIRQFNADRLARGRRFVADRMPGPNRGVTNGDHAIGTGPVHFLKNESGGLRFRLAGPLEGVFILRPVIIDKLPRYLFYREDVSSTSSD